MIWYNRAMKKIFIIMSIVLAFAGCRRTDVRDFTVSMPELTPADAPAIQAALAQYAGVDQKSVKFDFAARTLKLKYDSMQIAKKNIEMSIAERGLTANDVTPESVGAKRIAR